MATKYVLYDQSQPWLGSLVVTPTPYVVGPMLGAGPHREGNPVGIYMTSRESMTAPVPGTARPLMTIDSEVHFADPSYGTTPDAETEQLCFGTFQPAQEAEPPIAPAKFSIQDMLAVFEGTGAIDAVGQGCAAVADAHKQADPPQPAEEEGHAAAAADTHSGHTELGSSLGWGEALPPAFHSVGVPAGSMPQALVPLTQLQMAVQPRCRPRLVLRPTLPFQSPQRWRATLWQHRTPTAGAACWTTFVEWGDSLEQVSPEKDPWGAQGRSTGPVFNIVADAASAQMASIMVSMPSRPMPTSGSPLFPPLTGELTSAQVTEQPGVELAGITAAISSGEEEDAEATQQDLPEGPRQAIAAAPSLLGSLAAAALLAGCVAGAAVEEVLEAGPKAARMVLGQPQPAGGSLGVRLLRQATRAGYVAAGHLAGAGDAACAAAGVLAACCL